MHLASEVSSTTNPTMDSVNRNTTTNESPKESVQQPLTAETLAERTIDSLMAEHPNELVRTGSPHIVSREFR